VQRAQQRVVAALVLGAQRSHVRVEPAAGEQLGDDELAQPRAEDVGARLHERELVDDRRGREHPAQAQAGRERF